MIRIRLIRTETSSRPRLTTTFGSLGTSYPRVRNRLLRHRGFYRDFCVQAFPVCHWELQTGNWKLAPLARAPNSVSGPDLPERLVVGQRENRVCKPAPERLVVGEPRIELGVVL